MKIFFLIMLFFFPAGLLFSQEILLADNGKTNYRIIIPTENNRQEKIAAKILQLYLEKITGIQFPVEDDAGPEKPEEIIIGNTVWHNRMAMHNEHPGGDFYSIRTHHQKLIITGGPGKGIIHGVTAFLENHLGCRIYAPGVEKVPVQKTIRLGTINETSYPAAEIRIVNGSFGNDTLYRYFRRLDVIPEYWGTNPEERFYVHTFNRFVPPARYFKDHPEYFSMIKGERVHYGQLCLSNPHLVKIVTDSLARLIEKNPGVKYWSVSQNDNYYSCQCEQCMAIDKEEGSPAGTLLRFVNQVADAFPDKVITTLAYQYTRKPPLITRPRKNVMVTLCTIELNRSQPIEIDMTSNDFVSDIKGWSNICDNIMLWDYEVQFTNYLCPFPLFYTLVPNIQFFNKYNVKAHFQQCNASHGVELAELKCYLMSKALWDPTIDVNTVLIDFMEGYYGPAAPFVRQYFDRLHAEGQKANQRFDIYGSPVWHSETYLSEENLRIYNQIFDKAEAAVRSDPVLLERIRIARLPVRFSELEIAKTDLFGPRGWYTEKEGKFVLDAGMKTSLDSLYQCCRRNNIPLNENGGNIETYYANTLRFIDVQTEGNLAFRKNVSTFPMPDKRYFHKGPPMLTNGVRGTEDYKINWLGWEGEDCSVTIDLGEPVKCDSVTISTLQLPQVWIIHPESVSCTFSADGIDYFGVQTITNNPDLRHEPMIKNYAFKATENKIKSVKFQVKGMKKLPAWHAYAGEKSWIFIDEITVK